MTWVAQNDPFDDGVLISEFQYDRLSDPSHEIDTILRQIMRPAWYLARHRLQMATESRARLADSATEKVFGSGSIKTVMSAKGLRFQLGRLDLRPPTGVHDFANLCWILSGETAPALDQDDLERLETCDLKNQVSLLLSRSDRIARLIDNEGKYLQIFHKTPI